ncbi:hypothetical protein K493DRAFT_295091 [Basidiobolus meristosporus CBS 931.73]|uniref:Zn(2)-C6 fungal-type domain-containing protein n=1 Tax=Basidiobolus meristosporus CBS 931.73 TaxID=1314790 RepID=A0A1Y1ZDI1_9FUNG|nr:hypothetical protein K493DRAFT_295091 [Basidiobolus meristosporus CBS 931.73]|eukprot:ORY08298.1 hypothetical protein K493DRAFT_295091 [Basidiobolus meristosporus CBS 931.73]
MDSICSKHAPSETRSFTDTGTPQTIPITMLLSLNTLRTERSTNHNQTSSCIVYDIHYISGRKPILILSLSLQIPEPQPQPSMRTRPNTRVARRCKKYTASWNPVLRPIPTIEISYPTPPPSRPDNIKKVYVQKACINCKSSHVACDTSRPCLRCLRSGKSSTCIDASRRKRGRPSAKSTSSTDDSDTSIDSPIKLRPIGMVNLEDRDSLSLPGVYEAPDTIYEKTSLRAILLHPSDLDRKEPLHYPPS